MSVFIGLQSRGLADTASIHRKKDINMKPLAIRIVTVGVTALAVSSMLATAAMAGMRFNRCETFVRSERSQRPSK